MSQQQRKEEMSRKNAIPFISEAKRQGTILVNADNTLGNNARRDEILKHMKKIHFKTITPDLEQDTSEQAELYAIPYFLVGTHASEVKKEKGYENTQITYPDWHMITPAYDISFSGMTAGQLAKDMFNDASNPNHIGKRLKRWINEHKKVIYCDTIDKIATIVTVLLLMFTAVVTIWSLAVHAEERFVVPEGVDSPSADMLNSLVQNKSFKYAKAILTSISVAIGMWNVIKRTTVPKNKTIPIKSFNERNKVVNHPFVKKARKTFANLFGETPKAQIVPANIVHIEG